MNPSKKHYSDEFKEQALAKVYSRGQRTIQSIADESNLRIWLQLTSLDPFPGNCRLDKRSASGIDKVDAPCLSTLHLYPEVIVAGILSIHTLKNWMKNAASTDTVKPAPAKRPQDWRPEERLLALQESHGLSSEALNAWCRERGVFAHQLKQWQTDFCAGGVGQAVREEAQTIRHLKAENQRLERELKRKEKALAEAAALLVLQKKYQALLGGEAE